jgi:hypothetical protein
MSFNTSDKVVCVDDTPIPSDKRFTVGGYRFPGGMIKKGVVYVVSGMIYHPNTGRWGVCLVGHPVMGEAFNGGYQEAGWSPNRFRLFRPCAVNTPPILVKVDETPARTISDFPVLLCKPKARDEHTGLPRPKGPLSAGN